MNEITLDNKKRFLNYKSKFVAYDSLSKKAKSRMKEGIIGKINEIIATEMRGIAKAIELEITIEATPESLRNAIALIEAEFTKSEIVEEKPEKKSKAPKVQA